MNDLQKYRQAVKTHAEAILEEHPDTTTRTRDIDEAIWETTDSAQHIIYTNKNIKVLEHGENNPDGHLWKQTKDNADWKKIIQQMAFEVMEADIRDEIDRKLEERNEDPMKDIWEKEQAKNND